MVIVAVSVTVLAYEITEMHIKIVVDAGDAVLAFLLVVLVTGTVPVLAIVIDPVVVIALPLAVVVIITAAVGGGVLFWRKRKKKRRISLVFGGRVLN